jgi:hypothetical protein
VMDIRKIGCKVLRGQLKLAQDGVQVHVTQYLILSSAVIILVQYTAASNRRNQ